MAAKRAGKAKATGVVARPRYEESALWIRLLRTWHGLGAGVCVAIVLAMNIDWHLSVYARTVMFKDDNSTFWHRCLFLHHASPIKGADGDTLYRTGADDMYFVAFCTALLLFVRSVLRKLVFLPTGRAIGVVDPAETRKFAEQAWQIMYYGTAWCSGAYILTHTPGWDWANMESYWIGYPHRDLLMITKLYYLLQLAFWLSQIVVTLIEKWRKDFVEMMLHHVITSNLIFWSYYGNYTRMGIGILVEQDLADVFLPLAKLFKYAGWETLQNATFVVFTLTWIVTRHGIFFIFYHSAWTHPFRLLTAEEHWDPANGAFYTPNVIYAFLVVLTAFQLLLLFWLSLLIKAVKKALTEGDVHDERSDDEAGEPAGDHDVGAAGDDDIPPVRTVSHAESAALRKRR